MWNCSSPKRKLLRRNSPPFGIKSRSEERGPESCGGKGELGEEPT